ncbi:hypothetical protein P7D68_18485 [Enterococcus avium]|uniref:hypothetical protein n=1 Tax=Enterococcus TaxID=1350 RepID=UPI001F0CCB95|nr:hypothetical protein [Enterococcus avium]MDT2472181.1 hypothetical protein [Enterococcus avium]
MNWMNKRKYRIISWQRVALCIAAILVVLAVSTAGGTYVYADIQSSAKLAETGTEQLVKIIGNSALFICICLFGITQFFGVELGRWGKRLIFSAILGSAVILNATFLRDLIWGNVGG